MPLSPVRLGIGQEHLFRHLNTFAVNRNDIGNNFTLSLAVRTKHSCGSALSRNHMNAEDAPHYYAHHRNAAKFRTRSRKRTNVLEWNTAVLANVLDGVGSLFLLQGNTCTSVLLDPIHRIARSETKTLEQIKTYLAQSCPNRIPRSSGYWLSFGFF